MKKQKIILLAVIFVIVVLIRFTPVIDFLSYETIDNNRDMLLNYVENNYIFSAMIFIIVYFITISLSIPGATLLTITSGLLFGPVAGTIYTNIGATLGAVVIFLISRYLIGERVQQKYRERFRKFNEELDRNGPNYLLTLRFIPLFPFFLVNLFGGLSRIRLRTFAWTTSLGILPGSFVYAYAGHNLGMVISPSDAVTPEVISAFVLLGIFALIPVIYRKIKKWRADKNQIGGVKK